MDDKVKPLFLKTGEDFETIAEARLYLIANDRCGDSVYFKASFFPGEWKCVFGSVEEDV